jgi:chromosome segregation ATPase
VAKSSEPTPALVLAAQKLEDELRRCEEAAAEAARIRLNSEKHFERAARSLKTAEEHRQGLGPKLNELLAAIHGARERAEAAAARMEARAGEIRTRMERLQAFQAKAGEIAAAVREAAESAKEAKSARELLDRLAPIEERIAASQQEARAEEFDDVAHDLAALKEMIAGMRRKLEGK